MNFCRFFNQSMKKLSHNHQWEPEPSVNVLIGAIILLCAALSYLLMEPMYFLINKISVTQLHLPKIKANLTFAKIFAPIIFVVMAWILAMVYRDFFVQPISISWLAYGFGILLLNVIYVAQTVITSWFIMERNYERGFAHMSTAFNVYWRLACVIGFVYNKTSSSCPLKKE